MPKAHLIRFALRPEMPLPADLNGSHRDANHKARMRVAAETVAAKACADKVAALLVKTLMERADIQVLGTIRLRLVFDLLVSDEQLARFPKGTESKAVNVEETK